VTVPQLMKFSISCLKSIKSQSESLIPLGKNWSGLDKVPSSGLVSHDHTVGSSFSDTVREIPVVRGIHFLGKGNCELAVCTLTDN
jgi:hypothetical protein